MAASPIQAPVIQGTGYGTLASQQATSGNPTTGTVGYSPTLDANNPANPNYARQVAIANGSGTVGGAPTGTLTANISDTSSGATAPRVAYTSSAAQTDYANKQNQITQLNQDTANHNQIMAAATVPAPTDNSNTKDPAKRNTQSNTNKGGTTPTPSGNGYDKQINDLLSTLNTNSQSNQSDATKTENSLMDAQANLDAEQQQAYADTATKLNQIAQGVYPLSATEQNLLAATSQQFQGVIQAQTQANKAYTGQMTELMASLGINTSAPSQAIGEIQATIDSGNSKVADLNSQMATSLANLQQGFQKQDFDMVQTAWSDTAAQFASRATTLKDMLSEVTTQAKNAQDEIQQRYTDNLTAIMDSHTISYQEKDVALRAATLNETMRHDAATEAESRYQYNADGTVFDKATGKITTQTNDASTNPKVIGHTGNPIVDANTRKSASGIPYVDGTNLTGTAAEKAQMVAAQNGIPYVGKEQASVLNSGIVVRDNLKDLQNAMKPIVASSFADRPIVNAANALGGATQANTIIASLDAYKATAIPLLKSLSGGATNFRITQSEILNAQDKYLPKPTDTAAVINQKIAYINSILDDGEKGVFGDSTYAQFHPDPSNPLNLTGLGTPSSSISSNNPVGI